MVRSLRDWHHRGVTYTAARANGDLNGIPPWLANLLQVEWPVSVLVVTPVNLEWRRVGRDLHAGWPVGIHLSVLVVETFELQFQIGPAH